MTGQGLYQQYQSPSGGAKNASCPETQVTEHACYLHTWYRSLLEPESWGRAGSSQGKASWQGGSSPKRGALRPQQPP